ncbi:MAG: ATP-binding protein [Pseudomonadota bacterium]|nr:ATP-binding protein [Pseudomonadota bacterium]
MMKKNSRDDKFVFRIAYPWRSLLAALLLLFYGVLLLSPALAELLLIPPPLLRADYFIPAGLVFLILAWLDSRRFFRQQRKVRASMQQLWDSKRQLQLRAQTSASHAGKLKSFISDKLLEYIEYDEKYLHFKSIASEVRHNGVISFDKVQSALTYARDHSLPGDDGSTAMQYQEALAGMRYLWDLLDLSTTDNMALHIGAHVSRCEELLFQAELQGSSLSELPLPPVFSPRQALLDTLMLHLGLTLCDEHGRENPPLLFDEQALEQPLVLTDRDGIFRIEINACDDLPGNANHLILLLENLFRNAQFFATKRRYKSAFPPLAVRLWEAGQHLCLTVYNRGPHISDEAREQLFNLGFSTRRVREHHGKGLGLYFVQQITRGFDGDITFDNVSNAAQQYHLRLETEAADVTNINLEILLTDGAPLVRSAGSDDVAQKQWQHTLSGRLASVEISRVGSPDVKRLALTRDRQNWSDPQQPDHPAWQMKFSGRRQEQFSFIPQDIAGVQFRVRLPTISGRLDGVPLMAEEPDVDELEASFRSPDDF